MSPLSGQKPPVTSLENIPKLVSQFYMQQPDLNQDLSKKVSFGTSGHRGSSTKCTFNEAHIRAITLAIVEYRQANSIQGPLYLGKDTHALSEPAFMVALEVLVSHDVQVIIQEGFGYTPTPVISHCILNDESCNADGIIITPSHNPPADGGIKYNTPNGGPADQTVTQWVEDRANEILLGDWQQTPRVPYEKALVSSNVQRLIIFTRIFLSHDINFCCKQT